VQAFSSDCLERLALLRITTAEQFASIAKSDEGKAGLARHLGMTIEGLEPLISGARAALSPDVLARIDEPFDSGRFALGALEPKEGD
jgi:hypothetical protein